MPFATIPFLSRWKSSIFLAGAALCGGLSAEAAFVPASEIVAKVNQRYGNLSSLEADFREIYRGGYRRGVVKYKKPNLLNAKYLSADGSLQMQVVANSKKLYVYLRTINVVSEQDLSVDPGAAMAMQNPLGFARLSRYYSAGYTENRASAQVLTPAEAASFKLEGEGRMSGVRIALYPRDITQGMDRMEWWVDGEGWVRRSRSVTTEGRPIDIVFTDYRPDAALSDKEFDFDVPASAQVVKNALLRPEVGAAK